MRSTFYTGMPNIGTYVQYTLCRHMRDVRMFALPDIGGFYTLRKCNKCIIIIKALAIFFFAWRSVE